MHASVQFKMNIVIRGLGLGLGQGNRSTLVLVSGLGSQRRPIASLLIAYLRLKVVI
jgi:hypothetical protein